MYDIEILEEVAFLQSVQIQGRNIQADYDSEKIHPGQITRQLVRLSDRDIYIRSLLFNK